MIPYRILSRIKNLAKKLSTLNTKQLELISQLADEMIGYTESDAGTTPHTTL